MARTVQILTPYASFFDTTILTSVHHDIIFTITKSEALQPDRHLDTEADLVVFQPPGISLLQQRKPEQCLLAQLKIFSALRAGKRNMFLLLPPILKNGRPYDGTQVRRLNAIIKDYGKLSDIFVLCYGWTPETEHQYRNYPYLYAPPEHSQRTRSCRKLFCSIVRRLYCSMETSVHKKEGPEGSRGGTAEIRDKKKLTN